VSDTNSPENPVELPLALASPDLFGQPWQRHHPALLLDDDGPLPPLVKRPEAAVPTELAGLDTPARRSGRALGADLPGRSA